MRRGRENKIEGREDINVREERGRREGGREGGGEREGTNERKEQQDRGREGREREGEEHIYIYSERGRYLH